MAERSHAAARARREGTQRRRRRRAVFGALAVLTTAGLVGLAIGMLVGPSAEERAQAANEAAVLDRMISREVNRVLLELWKMESLEMRP